jgi:S1-C subfamily serine protease
MTVLPGGPGPQARVETGDVITAINGKASSNEVNQPAFLRRQAPNST